MARPKLACRQRGRKKGIPNGGKKDAQNLISITANIDPYENLANAIVVQAAKDYSEALKAKDEDARCKIDSIEKFFRSAWYGTLTDLNPEVLIKMLRAQAANDAK